jgi:hypothetical protein
MNVSRAARSAASELRADWTITDEIVGGSPSQFWCITMDESGLELFRFSHVVVDPRPFLPPRAGHLTAAPTGGFSLAGRLLRRSAMRFLQVRFAGLTTPWWKT